MLTLSFWYALFDHIQIKASILGPPVKCHSNGVSLTDGQSLKMFVSFAYWESDVMRERERERERESIDIKFVTGT